MRENYLMYAGVTSAGNLESLLSISTAPFSGSSGGPVRPGLALPNTRHPKKIPLHFFSRIIFKKLKSYNIKQDVFSLIYFVYLCRQSNSYVSFDKASHGSPNRARPGKGGNVPNEKQRAQQRLLGPPLGTPLGTPETTQHLRHLSTDLFVF